MERKNELLLSKFFEKFKGAKSPSEAVSVGDTMLLFIYTMLDESPPEDLRKMLEGVADNIEQALSALGEDIAKVKQAYQLFKDGKIPKLVK